MKARLVRPLFGKISARKVISCLRYRRDLVRYQKGPKLPTGEHMSLYEEKTVDQQNPSRRRKQFATFQTRRYQKKIQRPNLSENINAVNYRKKMEEMEQESMNLRHENTELKKDNGQGLEATGADIFTIVLP